MPTSSLPTTGRPPTVNCSVRLTTPRDLRHVLRHASEDFAVELLDNLRPPLLPPHGRGRDLAAVLQRQDFRQVRERIGHRLVVVGVVGRGLVAAGPWPQGRDTELLHHVPVIGGGCCGVWVRRRTARRRRCLRRRDAGAGGGCRLLGSRDGCRQHHRRACRGHTASLNRPDAESSHGDESYRVTTAGPPAGGHYGSRGVHTFESNPWVNAVRMGSGSVQDEPRTTRTPRIRSVRRPADAWPVRATRRRGETTRTNPTTGREGSFWWFRLVGHPRFARWSAGRPVLSVANGPTTFV